MVNRKSMNDALTLNPEKLAFIHDGGKATNQIRSELVLTKAIELPTASEETTQSRPESPSVPTARRGRKPRTASQGVESSADYSEHSSFERYQSIWVPLTTRLSPATAEGLRRAALELRLQRRKPHTQQEIVESAIRHWLKTNGFGLSAER
jgi:hypothetical protein